MSDRIIAGEPSEPGLATSLDIGTQGETVRDVLRRLLVDPSLDIVYPRVGTGGWIDDLGAATEAAVAGRALTMIDRGGKPVATLVHDPALLADPDRLRTVTEAASLAIDNERLKAQLRAQLAEVGASRARIVDAGDRALRRVERNLHDGAQQRLVALSLVLRLARRAAVGDAELAGLLADATRELDDALGELRDLARGIHPAILDDAGLVAALETLAERPGVPVELHLDVPDQLPEAIEVGVYYLVAEALTNVNKHAAAQHAVVRAQVVDRTLRLSISDDGGGSAAARPGSGLEGLADRLQALGGTLQIDSAPGRGTTISAAIPLTAPADAVPDADLERRRMTAIKWIGWENWEAPAELYEQITGDDNLVHGRAILLCIGGNRRLTAREREWYRGYLTAAGFSDDLLDQLQSYDDGETLEELMRVPGVSTAARGFLYDAIRIGASDGPLTQDDVDHLHRSAEVMGISGDLVTELCEIVTAEQSLRRRRYELIVAPALGLDRRRTTL